MGKHGEFSSRVRELLLPLVSIDGRCCRSFAQSTPTCKTSLTSATYAMPSRVTFEWTGGTAGELEKGGRHPTHVDGFMVAETDKGRRAYLIEWKYTEDGGGDYKGNRHPNQLKGYRNLYYACSSSFKSCVVMDELLYDPFDQIVRNRLLADRMVANGELVSLRRKWWSSCRRKTPRIESASRRRRWPSGFLT